MVSDQWSEGKGPVSRQDAKTQREEKNIGRKKAQKTQEGLGEQRKEKRQVSRKGAALYQQGLKDVESIVLPPSPEDNPDWFDIYQNYEIEAQRRDELKSCLSDNGIGTMIQWGGKAVHEMKKLGFTQSLPFTEELFTRLLMLPMNTSLTDKDMEYVCDCIIDFYKNN